MVISHKHRFVFIHIYKTGGSAIQSALASFASHGERELPIHPTAADVRRLIAPSVSQSGEVTERKSYAVLTRNPSAWSDYFKFAIVRNPWDWAVSLYAWLLQNPVHDMGPFVRELGSFKRWVRYLYDPEETIRSFRHGSRMSFRRPQWDFVSDEGQLIVNFVGRFERLADDFQTICNQIGIQANLRRSNSSRHPPYRLCYDREARRMIGELYRTDIEAFDFHF